MKRKNDQSWKPLAHLLSACGIPWIWYLADFIFSLLISMVTVRLPQMTGAIMQGEIFDKGLLADYVGITVFSMLLAFFSTVFGSWISLHTDRVLRKKIWEHFLYLPMTVYQTYKPSSLISRITQDTSGISYGISRDGGLHGCGRSLADPGICCDGALCFQGQLPYPGAVF